MNETDKNAANNEDFVESLKDSFEANKEMINRANKDLLESEKSERSYFG